MSRPNPLRTGQPVAVPGAIQQTSLQAEESSANFTAFPAILTQATPLNTNALQGEERQVASGINDPFPTLEAPGLLLGESVSPAPPATLPPAFSPLGSADPFATEQPQAVVPTHVLPVEQPVMEQPRTAAVMRSERSTTNEGTGTPGSSYLEGLQTPHLTIQKVFPDEVVIDQPATLKIVIHNVGNSVAKNVTMTDRVPQGTRLLSTNPPSAVSPNGELTWSVGDFDPNAKMIFEMKVLPFREGEIGSVATVNYTGEASGRITVTRPMLKVEVKAPAEVKLGEIAHLEITVSNPGSATVTNIVLEEKVPDGLYHRDGRVMQHKGIATLRPKESKKLTLPLTCIGSGNLVNHIIVTADGNLMVEDKTTIRAMAPILNLEIAGAQKRFLERRSDYRLVVANRGNASAHDVSLELALPAAVQFVSTNQSGVYEPNTHTVHWALEELPPQEAGEIELIVMPTQTGDHSLRFLGTGENGLKAEASLPVSIDGIPAIAFEIVGDATLVEVGKDAVYDIRVINRGTKAAENVKVWATLADGMTFVKAEGGRYQAQGGIVQFETIPRLAPKSENIYKLTARSQTEGDYRINIQVISDDLRSPIAKEESTRVYR
jgi:uncharacterized repeat protein (TIGR01451 family)